MAKNVKRIPEGYHSVTPGLMVKDAEKLIDFLKDVFDAKVVSRMYWPDGSVMHAEVRIGDSFVLLGEARGEMKPMPGALNVYVEDADKVYNRAMRAGATSIMKLADQFWGDRGGSVKDHAGNQWWILTHTEDVPPQDMQARADAFMKKMAKT
jgi:PhnB protein